MITVLTTRSSHHVNRCKVLTSSLICKLSTATHAHLQLWPHSSCALKLPVLPVRNSLTLYLSLDIILTSCSSLILRLCPPPLSLCSRSSHTLSISVFPSVIPAHTYVFPLSVSLSLFSFLSFAHQPHLYFLTQTF